MKSLRKLINDTPVGKFHMLIDDDDVVIAAGFDDNSKIFSTKRPVKTTNKHFYQRLIDDYFCGDRWALNEIRYKFEGSDFQKKVWCELSQVGCGQTISYSQLAKSIGHPKSQRAVAKACSQNPVALLVPCHRVVMNNGSLGGYTYGKIIKEVLLIHERAVTGMKII